jgi:hypothetical protein
MLPESPFSKTEIHELGDFSKHGTHVGFRLPDGRVLVNFDGATSHSVLVQIARAIGAELIVISGTWTFTPDPVQEFKTVKVTRNEL